MSLAIFIEWTVTRWQTVNNHMSTQKNMSLNFNAVIELRRHISFINIYLLFAYIHGARCQHIERISENLHDSVFEFSLDINV